MIFAKSLHFPSLLVPTVAAASAGTPDYKLVAFVVAILEALIANDTSLVESAVVALYYHVSGLQQFSAYFFGHGLRRR